MKSHAHDRKVSQTSSISIAHSTLQARPFAPIASPTPEQTLADMQVQLERDQRFGHSMERIDFTPRPPASVLFQPKLTIGAPGDKYEQEADRMAQHVVQQLHTPKLESSQPDRSVQRETQDEEDELQRSPSPDQIQRLDMPEDEDDELQRSSLVQRSADGATAASDDLENTIAQKRGAGQPLADTLRQPMEQAFGNVDFSGVNVHTDAQSDQLNRSIQAKAFTTGQDIFFRQGAYQPESRGGQELIAHELTHVVQQGAGQVKRKSDLVNPGAGSIVQRKFAPALTTGKAHLRDVDNWGVQKGAAIPSGTNLLVDDDNGKIKVEHNRFSRNTKWRPAVNVPPNHVGPVAGTQKGYIRSSKAQTTGGDLKTEMEQRIQGYLQGAEAKYPYLAGHLDKPKHIKFLLNKALRYDAWSTASLDTFVEAFGTLNDKFTRIEDGANYVADVLAHWKGWVHPENPDLVTLAEVNLVESDLHERGLGVVEVKFTKPLGVTNPQFGAQTNVHAFIKPEDKTLEQNLLGANPNSAASRINTIAGLTQPAEKLQTIKMESTVDNGTLVEAARGVSAENLWPKNAPVSGDKPIAQSFHETLIFAYLAGIDDLHKKNVFWDNANVAGTPTLVDADNVLSRNQMEDVENGRIAQSGFAGSFNKEEARKNKEAIRTGDNSEINSKILDVMMNNQVKRRQIIQVLKDAIAGHRGRVVPVRTNTWGGHLRNYPTNPDKDAMLARLARRQYLVREPAVDGVGFDGDVGAGLFGVAGKNAGAEFWDEAAERGQTKRDFESGVIPFYEYEFDTGEVTHNGTHIYNGQTLDQAMAAMLTRFGG